MHPGKQKLEELVAGLDGVTLGPWEQKRFPMDEWVVTKDCAVAGCNSWHGPSHRRPAAAEIKANAAHIARCDPDTIRSISDAYKALEADNERLRKTMFMMAEGWSNALELGLIPPGHRLAAQVLRDMASAALKGVSRHEG